MAKKKVTKKATAKKAPVKKVAKKTAKKKTAKKKTAKKKVTKNAPVKRTPAKAGKLSQAKGKAFENKIAKDLTAIFPHAHRQLDQEKDKAGSDIGGIDDKYKIQCKKYEKYVNINVIETVKAKRNEIPILVTAGNGKPPMVVLPWKKLLELLEQVEKQKPKESSTLKTKTQLYPQHDESKYDEDVDWDGIKDYFDDVANEHLLCEVEAFAKGVKMNDLVANYFIDLTNLGFIMSNGNSQKLAGVLAELGYKKKKVNGINHWFLKF